MNNLSAYTDGACRGGNPGRCSCAFVVYRDGEQMTWSGRALPGLNTNNVAEYNALLDLLRWAEACGHTGIEIFSDSALVVNQTNMDWGVSQHAPHLLILRNEAFTLLDQGQHTLKLVKGHDGVEGNERADEICNEVLDREENSVPDPTGFSLEYHGAD